jgi:hypothetical protein
VKRWGFLVLTIVLGVSFVGVVGALFSWASPQSRLPIAKAELRGTVETPKGVMPHAFLEISSWADSMAGGCHGDDGGEQPDWVTFCPTTNFQLPANALVTMTIRQYDGGEKITNPFFAQVHGTVDGSATMNGETFTQIDPAKVGHTFTMHSISGTGQDSLFVSVPLQLSEDENVTPNVIEFSFYTGAAGTYYWNCEFPCGDGTLANFGGPMATQGYMAGLITVV